MCSQHFDFQDHSSFPLVSCSSSSREHQVQAGCGLQRRKRILVFSAVRPTSSCALTSTFPSVVSSGHSGLFLSCSSDFSSLCPKPHLHFQVFFVALPMSRCPRHDSGSQRPGPRVSSLHSQGPSTASGPHFACVYASLSDQPGVLARTPGLPEVGALLTLRWHPHHTADTWGL